MKKNVWLIWIDSLSWTVFSDLKSRGKLPNIEKLAKFGVLFSNAISSATTTSPCTASLFTGRYPFRNGVRALGGYQLNAGIPTIAETLKQAGYRTVAMASGPLDPMLGLDRGFDQYDLRQPDENLYDEAVRTKIQKIITDTRKQPWFFFLHLWEAHAPYWLPGLSAAQRLRYRIQWKGRYEESLAELDKNLGNLFKQIDYEETIVILLADHGEIVGSFSQRLQHKINRKRGIQPVDSRYVHLGHGSAISEKLIHIPLIISADGLLSPGLANEMVRQVDIAPTIAELCGVPWPAGSDGRPLFDKQQAFVSPTDFALIEAVGKARTSATNWMIGGREARWKYVVAPLIPDVLTALYDLPNDPDEKINVVADYPAIAEEMKRRIEATLDSSIGELVWPEPTLETGDIAIIEDRLRELGYL